MDQNVQNVNFIITKSRTTLSMYWSEKGDK